MAEGLPISVCRVDTPDGKKDYVTCLSHEVIFQHGLPTEAIIGVLTEPVQATSSIVPENFARNRVFVEFLHEVIARCGPTLASLQEEAERQGNGWLYIIDQRSPSLSNQDATIPPEDIIGAFHVENGKLSPDIYQRNSNHQIFTENGFFQLGAELQTRLLEELLQKTMQNSETEG